MESFASLQTKSGIMNHVYKRLLCNYDSEKRQRGNRIAFKFKL